MRKFVIRYSKQDTLIMEVEVEKIPAIEDLSVMFLKPGEWKGKILKPESLYEKSNLPQGNLIPPISCWWAFHDDVESAKETLRQSCKSGFWKRKAVEAARAGLDKFEIDEVEMELEAEKALGEVKVIYL